MLIFIDFEASGLEPGSWPIEAGLARREGGRTQVAARLIRPEPDWSPELWSPESAAVHGIGLDELRAAEPAPVVAGWLLDATAGRTLISDAPSHDRAWMAVLLAALDEDVVVPRVHDFDVLVARQLDPAGVRRAYAHLDRVPTPHRAGPDARRLLEAWLAGRGVER